MLLAGVAAVLLIGAGIGGTALVMRPKPEEPVTVKDTRDDEKQKRLEEENKKLKDQLEEKQKLDKKRQEFASLMQKGKEGFDKQHYAEATKAFAEAVKLFPDDSEAKADLNRAENAVAREAQAEKDRQKRQADYDRLMADGRKALENKDNVAAQQAFEAALLVLPGDAQAAKALAEAKGLTAANETEKTKAEIEKKKQADFKLRMDAGQAAMVRQDYEGALREYLAALQILPGDPSAVKGLRNAQDRIEALMDKAKRQAILANLMDKARAALSANRLNEAIDAFQAVLNIAPNDRDAKQGLDQALKARDTAKAQFDKAKAQFDQHMVLATTAFQLQRYEEAAINYRAALRIFPDNPDALQGLAQLNRVVDTLEAAARALPRYLFQGQAAMQAGAYADAIVAFTEALRIAPTDPTALAGLRDARRALDRAVQQSADADRQLQAALKALQVKQYADAIRGFNAVLKLQPDNQRAIDGLRKATFEKAMADGRNAMGLRKYADAITFFEAALREVPGDSAATNQLRLAKQLNKGK